MKLKLDENGHVVLKDGFPVWVADDGTEIAYNVPDLVNKISAVNGESAGRRKEIDAPDPPSSRSSRASTRKRPRPPWKPSPTSMRES